jgi:hypothetical protein
MSGGSAHLGREEETVKGGGGRYFPPTIAFISGGERERSGRAPRASVKTDR